MNIIFADNLKMLETVLDMTSSSPNEPVYLQAFQYDKISAEFLEKIIKDEYIVGSITSSMFVVNGIKVYKY